MALRTFLRMFLPYACFPQQPGTTWNPVLPIMVVIISADDGFVKKVVCNPLPCTARRWPLQLQPNVLYTDVPDPPLQLQPYAGSRVRGPQSCASATVQSPSATPLLATYISAPEDEMCFCA